MVLIKEFRIVMPFNSEDYRRGSRYSVARVNKLVTNGTEGIEVLENREYIDEKTGVKGRYTKKIYHLENKVPGWVRLLAPSSVLKLDEESFDAYPNSKTILTNRFFGDRFTFTIESKYFDNDKGDQENAMNLSEADLKKRTVHKMDIGAEALADKDSYDAATDPTLFKSEKYPDQFSALTDGWQDRVGTHMCCYKLVTIQFKVFGVQGRGENYLMDMETQIFLKFHKQIFCWIDDWYGLSMDEIEAQETAFFEDMEGQLDVDAIATATAGTDQDPEVVEKRKKKKKKIDMEMASSSVEPQAITVESS